MPLLPAQQQLIEATIGHLLDFSTDTDEFAEEESALATAFNEQVDQSHPYYWIRECYNNPTERFQRLELLANQAPPLTIAEVQQYMLNFITSRLALSGQCVHWDQNKIVTENASIPFVTKRARVEDNSEHPYTISNLEGKIFSCMMELESSYNMSDDEDSVSTMYQPFVNVTVICGEKIHNQKIALGKKVPATQFQSDDNDDAAFDANQDAFIEKLKPQAKKEAEIFAAQCAVPYLRKMELNVLDTANHGEMSTDEISAENDYDGDDEKQDEDWLDDKDLPYYEAIRLIVTNQFYFDQLEQQNIYIQDIIELSKNKAECLIHPTIIELIQTNILSFTQAKKLMPWQVKIITHPAYYALLIKKEIDITDIEDIIRERASFLMTPPIANLIQTGKLPFTDATLLPLDFKSVVVSPLYDGYFSKHEIPWHTLFLLEEDDCDLLLNKKLANLIVNGIIPINDVPNIVKLSFYMMKALHNCPRFLYWLEHKFISLSNLTEYNKSNIHHLYIDIYAMRFKAVLYNDPFKIDGKIDTVQNLMDELLVAAAECKCTCSLQDFKQSIVRKLILSIKSHIETTFLAETSPHEINLLWVEFLIELKHDPSVSSINWLGCLNELIAVAKRIRDEVTMLCINAVIANFNNTNSLFYNSQQARSLNPADQLKSFCDNLMDLSLLDPPSDQMRCSSALKNSS